jgi:putative hydrolase of the HAD superfamily
MNERWIGSGSKNIFLLFDLFGVIARNQSESSKRCLEALGGVEPGSFWEAYWAARPAFDLGQPAASYWRAVGGAIGVTYDTAAIAALIAADLDSWREVDDAMVAYLRELYARGMRLGLLSNIPWLLAEQYRARHEWLRLFSLVAFSCEIGHIKPQPEAYQWCCTMLRCDAGDIAFFDDREENVQAAVACGLKGRVFISCEQLKTELRGLLTPLVP